MSLVECFVVGVDVQKFSRRKVRHQIEVQKDLDWMLDEAAESAGISRKLWRRREEGDGETAVLPPGVNLVAVVRTFISELNDRLTYHNRDHLLPDRQIRLRVAMHSDVIANGRLGDAGPALIDLRRLLDSVPVRSALTDEVNLAQIISESLYQKAVVPEIGGLLPEQFQKVRVNLPDKGFNQWAYVHVPPGLGPRSGPLPKQVKPPSNWPHWLVSPEPPNPPPTTRPQGDSRSDHRELPQPPSEPSELSPAVHELVRSLRKALEKNEIRRADTLTTLSLLEVAGRRRNGWLRASDGPRLPYELFTEVDSAWSESSGGAWGFRTQRKRIDRRVLSGPKGFQELSVTLGWRSENDEVIPSYDEFARRADHDRPFYPTLRHPEREPYTRWHDEWRATVRAVYDRLLSWEQ